MRTPIEALKEIRDRLTYFCLRTDGKYDPPWATELVGIIDEAVTGSHAFGNAAARDEVVLRLSKDEYKGMQEALSEHDRLCEMLSESRKSVGNAAAMREALVGLAQSVQDFMATKGRNFYPDMAVALEAACAALSTPARNCDVGTAEKQIELFELWCVCTNHDCCKECEKCFAHWAQLPYQEGETKCI